MEKIAIPPRVAFVNINDGSVFFDCNPAEARVAMKAIKDYRCTGEFRDEIEYVLRLAKWVTNPDACHQISIIPVGPENPLTISLLNKILASVEQECMKGEKTTNDNRTPPIVNGVIVVDAMTYAYIRGWGKTVYDEFDDPAHINASILGKIWGYHIVCSNLAIGRMHIAAEARDGTMVYASSPDPNEREFETVNLQRRAVDATFTDEDVEEPRCKGCHGPIEPGYDICGTCSL